MWNGEQMSTVQGAGISVATVAPTVSTFVIQARDSYGNARTSATRGTSCECVRREGGGGGVGVFVCVYVHINMCACVFSRACACVGIHKFSLTHTHTHIFPLSTQ